MVLNIEAELKEWGLQSVRGEVSKPPFFAIMKRSVPAIDAGKEAELVALEALFEPEG